MFCRRIKLGPLEWSIAVRDSHLKLRKHVNWILKEKEWYWLLRGWKSSPSRYILAQVKSDDIYKPGGEGTSRYTRSVDFWSTMSITLAFSSYFCFYPTRSCSNPTTYRPKYIVIDIDIHSQIFYRLSTYLVKSYLIFVILNILRLFTNA